MLEMIGEIRSLLTPLADTIADQIVERIWDRVATNGTETDLEPLFRRGRLLLLQGVASTLADRLGDALLSRGRGEARRGVAEHDRPCSVSVPSSTAPATSSTGELICANREQAVHWNRGDETGPDSKRRVSRCKKKKKK